MKSTTRIGIVLGITLGFFIAEVTVGFKTRSLAVIANAFHNFTYVVAYAIAFIAAYTSRFTFVFNRAELVGTFFNGVFLVALALSVFLQSVERFVHIEEIEDPFLMFIIGCVGLGLNTVSGLIIYENRVDPDDGPPTPILQPEVNPAGDSPLDDIHANHNHTISPPAIARKQNLALLGVLVHVLGDTLNNAGVVVAAFIMWKKEPHNPGRFYADPAVSALISLLIFAEAIHLTLKSGRVLLEATPLHLDLVKVEEDLLMVPRVLSVHDFHVWQLSQSVILASLHVCVPPGTSLEEWEKTEQTLLHCFMAYGIGHVTISPELQHFEAHSVPMEGCKRISSQDGYGCTVNELKKRPSDNV